MSPPVDRPERAAEPDALSPRQIADLVGGRVEGPDDVALTNVAPIDQAGPDELGLLAMRRYLPGVETTRAGALLVSEELASDPALAGGPPARIVVEDPYRALPPLLERLHPPSEPPRGIHPTAVVGPGVVLGHDVHVGPYVVLEAGARIGDGARIGAHAVVGPGSRIGEGSVLHPHVVLYPGSVLGRRVILHAGVKVGVDGFGYVAVDGGARKIPQVGSCVIGDDVEIGANSTVDRGSIGRTVVGEGSKLDNLVHLGHNVEVGARSLLAAQVGIAGSTRLGDGVRCGGQAGASDHLRIGEGARLAARAGVIGDVEAGETVAGFPARERREFLRATALIMKLPELRSRIRDLERALGKAEGVEAEAGSGEGGRRRAGPPGDESAGGEKGDEEVAEAGGAEARDGGVGGETGRGSRAG